MAIKTWNAKIKLPNGLYQEVTVRADSYANAKTMLENQYGKGCVMNGPNWVNR
jgi:hypothetical protein